MNDNVEMQSVEESDQKRRTLIFAMLGVVIAGTCALFLLAYSWFQPDQISLIAKYFPSPTPTRRPTSTPAPTHTPIPNLTATQQAWVKPAQSPSPGTAEEAKSALDSGIDYVENFSFVFPDMPSISQPGDIYIFEITLTESEPLIWSYGWCTTTQQILEENFSHIQLEFTLNETTIPAGNFAIVETSREDGSPCREHAALVTEWTAGQHQLESRVTFKQDIDDGWDVYPAGTHIFKYIVTVQP
jgi:hypothetical protein